MPTANRARANRSGLCGIASARGENRDAVFRGNHSRGGGPFQNGFWDSVGGGSGDDFNERRAFVKTLGGPFAQNEVAAAGDVGDAQSGRGGVSDGAGVKIRG